MKRGVTSPDSTPWCLDGSLLPESAVRRHGNSPYKWQWFIKQRKAIGPKLSQVWDNFGPRFTITGLMSCYRLKRTLSLIYVHSVDTNMASNANALPSKSDWCANMSLNVCFKCHTNFMTKKVYNEGKAKYSSKLMKGNLAAHVMVLLTSFVTWQRVDNLLSKNLRRWLETMRECRCRCHSNRHQ